MLQGSAALSLAAFAALADAADNADDHAHMHEHDHNHGPAANPYAALAAATTHCIASGEACIAHCLDLLGQGDKDMAACARSVQQMLATCTALRQLAAAKSPYVPRLAKVVADICLDCEKECRKHEKQHQECHDCAESCAACAKECAAVAAA